MPSAKATIAAGGTTSNAVRIDRDSLPCGLIVPALTTSTAITFTVSSDFGGTYVPLHEQAGDPVTAAASTSAARATALDPTMFAAWTYLKCVVADAQAETRDIMVCMK